MNELAWELAPWLIPMAALIVGSALCSASEAALFTLRPVDRRLLAAGSRSQRAAARLLEDPERLLSAVLFWNLVINITYFALAAVLGLRLQRLPDRGQSAAVAVAGGSLLALVFFSEMLPKTIGVLIARRFASLVGLPLAAAVRAVDPLMPVLRGVNRISQRVLWPRFAPEPPLAPEDLERAIDRSTSDAQLAEQERAALRNIVMLSEIRADEWMRPRTQYRVFRPPVRWRDLEGQATASGYVLVSEPDSEEVAAAIALNELFDVSHERLDRYAEPVAYAPWCATVADVLQQLWDLDRDVAAIVNEYGETIGVLTMDDIVDTVFSYEPSRSGRLLDRAAIQQTGPDTWLVSGMTSLRRLARRLGIEPPAVKSVTVAGLVQEQLGRLARPGDECRCGPLRLRVLDAPERGVMTVELGLAGRPGPKEERGR